MQKILLTLIVMLMFGFSPDKVYKPVVVLELFTSQGCSSCPAADVLLQDVKQNYPETVIPLSYHVDYWNYIGWKDPFSKTAFTEKQRAYNRKFNYGSIYTPQIVVNGKEHFVGSRKNTLASKIKTYLNTSVANDLSLKITKNTENEIRYNYTINGDVANKMLRVVLVIEKRITSIKRGENKHRTLQNANIVVAENYSDLTTVNGEGSIKIPKLVNPDDKLRLVGIVATQGLDVTGATQVKL